MRFSQIYCYPCKVFNFLPLSQLNWTFTPVEIIYMATQHLCKNQYFFFIINNRNDLITIEQFLTIDFLYVQIQGFTSWSLGCEKGLFTSLICYPSLKMLAERLSRNTNLDFRCQTPGGKPSSDSFLWHSKIHKIWCSLQGTLVSLQPLKLHTYSFMRLLWNIGFIFPLWNWQTLHWLLIRVKFSLLCNPMVTGFYSSAFES